MILQTGVRCGSHPETLDSIWPRHHGTKRDGERNANKTLTPGRELGEADHLWANGEGSAACGKG